MNLLQHKYYQEESVFKPENLIREAKRQKGKKEGNVPNVCLLDPDGDLIDYLRDNKQASLNEYWACYHSKMHNFKIDGVEIGIVANIVGSSYAVLVAEQLFASGCKYLVSVTSAGIINHHTPGKRFALITEAIRDEGTSYHYLASDSDALLSPSIRKRLSVNAGDNTCPYFEAKSWTTDAPYRETLSAITAMEKENVCCVEMEASALYAFAEARQKNVVCFAHLTNTMAQSEGDFEKGEFFGSIDTLQLLAYLLKRII
jgi:uridine phosphorylase